MEHRYPRNAGVKYMLAGGSAIAALGLLMDLRGLIPNFSTTPERCQEIVQAKSVLSREQLSQLLSVPEGSNRNQLRQIMNAPYCRLSNLEVRAGVTAQREAYPLAFDPQTWFVVLYEGDQYIGYSFSFRR
ncbi:MAG: hypothetical protein ACP5RH_17070 [Leptodesmis sp.]|uniref:hypothetical protein n=1 Tax=Leptodesmis sp. TaxID=3100501 RepID=UPI003D0DD3B2